MEYQPVALAVAGVTVRYGPLVALGAVTFDVGAGEVVGLVGPNGSGKSTALRLVVGLQAAGDGSVLVDGSPAGSDAARRLTAYVPDVPDGFDELTVGEFLRLTQVMWRSPSRRERVDGLLEVFGLAGRRRALLGSLSHGTRRLVSMVAALSLSLPVLVVDEATAGLDPEAVVTLREALSEVARQGGTVLLATQDLGFAQRCCGRVVLLNGGRVLTAGTPGELQEVYGAGDLEAAFLAAVVGVDRREGVRRALAHV